MNPKKAAMEGFWDEQGERYTPVAGRVKRGAYFAVHTQVSGLEYPAFRLSDKEEPSA
jgi:hypothetical protein